MNVIPWTLAPHQWAIKRFLLILLGDFILLLSEFSFLVFLVSAHFHHFFLPFLKIVQIPLLQLLFMLFFNLFVFELFFGKYLIQHSGFLLRLQPLDSDLLLPLLLFFSSFLMIIVELGEQEQRRGIFIYNWSIQWLINLWSCSQKTYSGRSELIQLGKRNVLRWECLPNTIKEWLFFGKYHGIPWLLSDRHWFTFHCRLFIIHGDSLWTKRINEKARQFWDLWVISRNHSSILKLCQHWHILNSVPFF